MKTLYRLALLHLSWARKKVLGITTTSTITPSWVSKVGSCSYRCLLCLTWLGLSWQGWRLDRSAVCWLLHPETVANFLLFKLWAAQVAASAATCSSSLADNGRNGITKESPHYRSQSELCIKYSHILLVVIKICYVYMYIETVPFVECPLGSGVQLGQGEGPIKKVGSMSEPRRYLRSSLAHAGSYLRTLVHFL